MKLFITVLFQFGLIVYSFSQYDAISKEIRVELKRVSAPQSSLFKKVKSFYFSNEFDSTLLYSNKCLETLDNSSKLYEFCLYFRGFSADKKGLYDEARNNYSLISKAFPFYDFVQLKLGAVELKSVNYESALKYFVKLEEAKVIHPHIDEGILLNNIGICYLHLHDLEKSESYLMRSSKLLEADSTNTDMLINTYTNLACLLYDQYKDDLAIPYYMKAYDLSKKTKDYTIRMETARNMAVVEENRDNFAKSIEYRKEFDNWKDSLNDQNKVWEIAQLEKKHISEQGKKREEVLQAENKAKVAQRNGFIYSSILLLILLGTGVYFYIQKLRSNKIILAQKKELGILNATKDRLFSIVSHDLRSNVNGLRLSNSKLTKHLEEENYAELREIVRSNGSIANSTYSLLDNLLNWAMIQTEQLYFNIESVNLYSVVDQVSFNYLPLMEEKGISFENRVSRQILVQADLDSLKIILRNLLDNAIKYSSENGSIAVYTKDLPPNRCEIIIEDTGNGMSEKAVDTLLKPSSSNEALGNGLGLQLCKELIEKNNGNLTVQSNLGEGTKMGVILQKLA